MARSCDSALSASRDLLITSIHARSLSAVTIALSSAERKYEHAGTGENIMRHILSSGKVVFVLIQFVLAPFIVCPSLAAVAMEPDIPKIQSEAERGSIQEQIELAAAYFVGRGVNQDEKLAAYWYEKAANAGDPAAENQIGYFYEVGIGVPKDLARAVLWYERAAASGLVKAKVNLGVVYLFGLGVRKDEGLAAQLFKEAVKKGSGLGACYLGDMYYLGAGAQIDKGEAEHWYE